MYYVYSIQFISGSDSVCIESRSYKVAELIPNTKSTEQ